MKRALTVLAFAFIAIAAAAAAAFASWNATGTGNVTASTRVDWLAPTAGTNAIGIASGRTTGALPQGGTYYVYANPTDDGAPASGIASVSADVSSITTGATSVPLVEGSFTAGGSSYGYRSALLTADASLTAGATAFSMQLTDNAANVRTQAGSVTIDNSAPPAPSILTHPGSPSSSTSATFTFSDTESGVTFDCVLDLGAPAACASPTYPGLSDGSHTFSVRARDAADNASISSFIWSVDTTGPVVGITFPSATTYAAASYIAGCGTPAVADLCGSASDANLSTVTLTITKAGQYWNGASFVAGAQTLTPSGTTNWSYNFTPPVDASYTVTTTANDALGHSTSTSVTFTYDTTAPTAPTLVTKPAASTSSTSATFTWTDVDPTVASYECKLDTGSFATCTSGLSYSALTVGSHTFHVHALDAIGNASADTAYTWSIVVGTLDHFNVTAPATSTAGTSFSVTVTAADSSNNTITNYSGIVHFTSNDAQAVLPANYTFVSGDNGAHTFTGVVLKTSGTTRTVAVNDTVQTTKVGSATVNVSAAAASIFKLVNCSINGGTAGTCTAPFAVGNGGNLTAQIDITDAFGNVPAATTVSIALTSNSGMFVVTGSPAIVSGSGSPVNRSSSFTVTYTSSGTATSNITAHATGFTDLIFVVKK